MFRRRILITFCGVLLAVSLVGCGGSSLERASMKGTVKFDGEPIEQGMIAFVPMGDTPGLGGGAEIVDGAYEIPKDRGPSPGKHRVEITATKTSGRTEVQGVKGSTGGGVSGPGTADVIQMYIPAKYNSKSEETYDVESGDNEKDFELTSK